MNNHQGEIIYYNCIMNKTTVSDLAEFQEERTSPLIINPSEYYISVIRFSLDGQNLPLFVFPVIPDLLNPANANNSGFIIALRYNNTIYQRNVQYASETSYPTPLPPTLTRIQDNSTPYYYVYYVSHFIKLINDTFDLVYNDMITANPVLTGIPQAYYIYDENLQKISLISPNTSYYITQYETNPISPNYNKPLLNPQPANTIQIFINTHLNAYLEGIKSFYINDNSITGFDTSQGSPKLLEITDNKNNYYYPPQNAPNIPANQTLINFTNVNDTYTTAPEWLIFTQQYNIIANWSSLSTIAILTTMPIQNEYIPTLRNSSSINILGDSYREILTDFVPSVTTIGEQRQRYIYNPSIYRYTELKSTLPLTKIQLKIYWVDQNQNLYPLTISSNKINTVKLMFIKKDIIHSGYNKKLK